MQPIPLSEVALKLEGCLSSGKLDEFEGLLWPALDQASHVGALWYYAGSFFTSTGRNALGALCYQKAYELEPSLTDAISAWGANMVYLRRHAEARDILAHALQRDPNHVGALVNLSGTYVNEGNPEPGIAAGERAVALDGLAEGKFNLALLHLEAGNFARGFDLYADGKHRHREERDYFTPGSEPPVLTPALHAQLAGRPFIENGGKRPLLVVWGEQGIGDELMFGTLLEDVIRDYEVVLDCHPRLEQLHRTANWVKQLVAEGRPGIIVPTRKNRGDPAERPLGVAAHEVAAKVAIGDLCRIYRRERSDFKWTGPVYEAPEAEMYQLRAALEAQAKGRKIVALATRGGTVSTATRYRRLPQKALEILFERKDIFWIGADYEDMSQVASWALQNYPGSYTWPAALNFAWDYHHMAALLGACDAFVTVPQSIMHLGCGMGIPTHVLTPSCPDWRLGVAGEFVWYPGPHVQLHRQQGSDWESVARSVLRSLDAQFAQEVAA